MILKPFVKPALKGRSEGLSTGSGKVRDCSHWIQESSGHDVWFSLYSYNYVYLYNTIL